MQKTNYDEKSKYSRGDELKSTTADLTSKIKNLENQLKSLNEKGVKLKFNKNKKESRLQCSMCGDHCNQNIDLERHMKNKHSQNAEKFSCVKCDHSFLSKWRLKQHMKIHEENVK